MTYKAPYRPVENSILAYLKRENLDDTARYKNASNSLGHTHETRGLKCENAHIRKAVRLILYYGHTSFGRKFGRALRLRELGKLRLVGAWPESTA